MPTSDPRGAAMHGRRGRPGPLSALAPALALALVLAACETPGRGLSGRDAELERLTTFSVLNSGETRVVFSARGREIVVEPPKGYCLDEESVSVTERSAFVLVADCIDSHQATLASGDEEDLPRVFPGILTVTVSGEEAFGAEPGALAAFERLLGSEAGGRLLGRGNGSGPGRVIAARRIGGALYVLVEEETAEGAAAILAPRFWRAFTEINDRLVLVTVSGFSDRELAEDEMLVFLASQMAKLRAANGLPKSGDEARIVEAVRADTEAPEAPAEAGPRSAAAPLTAPLAPRRPG